MVQLTCQRLCRQFGKGVCPPPIYWDPLEEGREWTDFDGSRREYDPETP
jgi:predicted metal-binding protein